MGGVLFFIVQALGLRYNILKGGKRACTTGHNLAPYLLIAIGRTLIGGAPLVHTP